MLLLCPSAFLQRMSAHFCTGCLRQSRLEASQLLSAVRAISISHHQTFSPNGPTPAVSGQGLYPGFIAHEQPSDLASAKASLAEYLCSTGPAPNPMPRLAFLQPPRKELLQHKPYWLSTQAMGERQLAWSAQWV